MVGAGQGGIETNLWESDRDLHYCRKKTTEPF